MSRSVDARVEAGSASRVTLPDPPSAPLLDVQGVADRLNISVRHVRRLVAERRIPYLKLGNLLRFDPVEVEGWLNGLHNVDRRSRKAH